MKPSLFALFFLIAFIASSAKAESVLDANGNLVLNGGTYYIVAHTPELGGGLRLATTGNETIPLSVVQSPSEVDPGLRWRIVSPSLLQIPTNSGLDFYSVLGQVPPSVPFPSRWNLIEGDNGNKSVKISRIGIPIIARWFKIQLVPTLGYKIQYCPPDGDICGDLGISTDENGKRLLVITDDNPLVVVFKRNA